MTGFARFPFARAPFAAMGPTADEADAEDVRTSPTAPRAPLLVDGDYVADARGGVTDSDDPVDAAVAWLLATRRSSFANARVGHRLFDIQTLTRTTIVQTRDEVMRALEPLISRGTIANVVVEPAPFALPTGLARNTFRLSYSAPRRLRR